MTDVPKDDWKHWLDERNRLLKHAVDVGDMKPEFVERINFAEERLGQALGIRTVSLLESLDSETKRLNKLTTTLIILTVVLSLLTIMLVLRI